jgi:RND family efflux transporter MFP subunit
MRRQFRRLGTVMTGGLAALALATGCERPEPKLKTPDAPIVSVALPVTDYVTDYEEFTGRTDAVYSIDIRARVTGYLQKVPPTDGAEVNKGDLLFEIDPRPYKAELARMEATLAQNEAHLKRLDADFRRVSSLYSRGNAAREEFDKSAGDRSEAEAAVGIATASRDLALLNESFTRVEAPISGRLSRRLVDPWNLVKADETSLTTIVSLDPLYVYFDVDERTMLKLRRLTQEGRMQSREEGQIPIEAGLSDETDANGIPHFPHKGMINFSENKVDPSTGTLRVRASIDNPKPGPTKPRVLSPGLFIRVRLPVGSPRKSILVPEQAVGTDQGRKFIYVVGEDNKVIYRPVTVGKLQNGKRVIEGNLEATERVVVSGLQRVRPGGVVKPNLVDDRTKAVPSTTKTAARN